MATRMLGGVLIGIALCYGLLAAALFALQSHLVYFPQPGRGDSATRKAWKTPFEEIRFPTADGESLHGWFILAPGGRADWIRAFDAFLGRHLPAPV